MLIIAPIARICSHGAALDATHIHGMSIGKGRSSGRIKGAMPKLCVQGQLPFTSGNRHAKHPAAQPLRRLLLPPCIPPSRAAYSSTGICQAYKIMASHWAVAFHVQDGRSILFLDLSQWIGSTVIIETLQVDLNLLVDLSC